MGKAYKTQQRANLVPSRGIELAVYWLVLSFSAVFAVSFGPEWVSVPVVVAYLAIVG